ncbi:hypothetical protein RGQ29_030140 [Quercus rubra]|uniref:Uncharacterized protein n=1 Tax=Quercus rubra TaxID=3512 RepID=A0AAN7EH83_QUERU|nr:hypothetical protein RGQ29_030140 [Quercus rubra]
MAANPKPVEGSMPKTHLTPMSQSAPKPQPQPQGPPSVPTRPMRPILPKTHKRKLIDTTFSNPNSSYFKIRALTQQLRPHFSEVLHTPDFRNHKAADEVQKCMRLLLDLYKQMTVELGNPRKFVPHCQVFSSGNMPGKGNQKGKRPKPLQAQRFMNSAENKPPTIPFSSEKTNSGHLKGSYILGNSDFGKNFITYLGSKPVYYGVTKESHRSRYNKQ